MYRDGKCYKYMYLDKHFRNSLSFSDESNTSLGEEYTLSTNSETNCYYDLKLGTTQAVRFHLQLLGNGSKLFFSALTGKNQYSNLELNTSNSVNSYDIKQNSGVLTYNLSTPHSHTLYFKTTYDANSVKEMFEALRGGRCPTMYYKYFDNGEISVTGKKSDNAYDDYSSAESNNRYNTTDNSGDFSENADGNASQSAVDVECKNNGKIPILIKYSNGKPVYDDAEASYNVKLQKTNEGIKYCVEIDNGYQCSKYTYQLTYSSKAYTDEPINFALDTDLREKIENSGDDFKCPGYIGIYYLNGGSVATSHYVVTTDSSKTQWEIYEGENDNPGRGVDNQGTKIDNNCEGLLGPNTIKFLRLVLRFIMIIGPVIALILGTYDLIVAMANGEEDAKKKGIKKMRNRLIAAALLLLLPYIITLILNIAGKGGSNCL